MGEYALRQRLEQLFDPYVKELSDREELASELLIHIRENLEDYNSQEPSQLHSLSDKMDSILCELESIQSDVRSLQWHIDDLNYD